VTIIHKVRQINRAYFFH